MDKSPLKQKLPAELRLMVLDELCPQLIQAQCRICVIAKCTCGVEGLGERKVDPELVKSVQALAALNRTCKELRQLTTRLLYACPLSTPNKAWWFLARTLITRPELAKLVTTLVLSENNTKRNQSLELPPEIRTYVLNTVRSYPLAVQEHQLDRESYILACIATVPYRPPADFMLSLCPNIERLCVYSHVDGAAPGTFLPAGTTFLALRTISIHDQYMPSPQGAYQLLVAHAPNVETLYLRDSTKLLEEPEIGGSYEGWDSEEWEQNGVPEPEENDEPDPVVLHNVKYFAMGEIYQGNLNLISLLPLVPNVQELVINMGIGGALSLAGGRLGYTIRHPYKVTSPTGAAKAVEKQGANTKLRRVTLNYMADYWSRTQEMLSVYEKPFPINYAQRYVQRFRDELDEATETFAQMGIDFVCTFPPDDWILLGCLNYSAQ